MADSKDLAILIGSVAAAGTLGYAYGKGRIRMPNPDDGREENPTGFPMSAGEISEGPHAGKVMYRPKLKGQKQRPRVYIEPGSAESLEERTEDTVDLRQAKAGKKRRRGKAQAPAVKKKAEKKVAPKPEPKKKAKRAAKKPAPKPSASAQTAPGGKKAPPRVNNPGVSTSDLVRSLTF